MEYIGIKQAAQKWNITERRVQELCKNGQIEGVTRLGRAWMIPHNAEKPVDGRIKKLDLAKAGEASLPMPRKNPLLICTDLYGAAGMVDKAIEAVSHIPEAEKMLKSQFDYLRGNVDKSLEESLEFINAHSGFNAVISAGFNIAKCAVWKGDINLWRQARQHIYEAPCKNEEDRQVLMFWLAATDSLIYDTTTYPDWFKYGLFDCLPAESYPVIRVAYVKYLFISAHELALGKMSLRDVDGLGLMRTLPYIIEPMICQAKIEHTLIPEISLHLMAGAVYHNLGEDKKAIVHVDRAIELCLPDKFYSTLVEYRTDLDGILDDRLALIDLEVLKRVRELHSQMKTGWLKLHNLLLERNVVGNLTVREREVAKLAAFGMSNIEIAKRLHIELSSVKRYIFSAMNKVGVSKRRELGQYI